MLKKLVLVLVWFTATTSILISSIVFLHQQRKSLEQNRLLLSKITEGNQPANQLAGQVLGVKITDMRPYLIANFLKKTQLATYSQFIVEVSDKYGIDYRLIPAIAMKETGGGNTARAGSYNAWGFENGRTNFVSWEQAIDKVAKTLKERYIAKGLVTPEQIMAVYAPPQLLTGGKWAKDIHFFFSKMENL